MYYSCGTITTTNPVRENNLEEKMKTMKITACVLLAAMLLSVMVSCVGGSASIVGKWVATVEGIETSFEFKPDGTGKMGAMGIDLDITYKADASKITVTMSMMGEEETTEFTYKLEGNKLSLTADGETVVYTKA